MPSFVLLNQSTTLPIFLQYILHTYELIVVLCINVKPDILKIYGPLATPGPYFLKFLQWHLSNYYLSIVNSYVQ